MDRVMEDQKALQAPTWTREYVFGLLMVAADAVEADGHGLIGAQLRHLTMSWYTRDGMRPLESRPRRRPRRRANA